MAVVSRNISSKKIVAVEYEDHWTAYLGDENASVIEILDSKIPAPLLAAIAMFPDVAKRSLWMGARKVEVGFIPMLVTIGTETRPVPCVANPRDTWNGWIKPFFAVNDLPILYKMLKNENIALKHTTLSSNNLTLVFTDGETEVYDVTMLPDGKKYVPVGAGYWTWSQYKGEADES